MKKILITGSNSYIGTSIEKYLEKYSDEYSTDTLDMKDDSWKEKDFTQYDVIFHVAGIAHVSSDPKMEELYYKVNRDLTVETAKKAKKAGVKQFIFMSSIIVYGDSSNVNGERIIDKNTALISSNFYGDSKIQAEKGIKPLESDDFKIVILRPPMIYGKGSKGNYPKLAKLAQKLPVFPDIDNKRSMLHIDNLCEFIRLMIVNEESGLFFPQNSEYVKTSEMVKLIAESHGTRIRLTKIFNPLLRLMGLKVQTFSKVFGSLVYEKSMSDYKEDYRIRDLKSSIIVTETVTTTESVATTETVDTIK
ncbi:NAD-dependent epimerase/dehydratase family protein [Clostridium sp. CF011]|uniref:NAD-dependent epimerase/dehydratase family protein n=1 Tax=Clostridium sp. CF011 TaxID=2843318 RepID=UPI001C0DD720|nr:NAD-dependent epimerase/dehydratase family protein [Clostridium sp. CF011]MBU3093188.1 NAD-dependent epimerase/dehydratase family protein [Clostridium sp. CF011]WAG69307.1 NAD-dependent epimerase/dehydratase family protein [Clostridium sp. CF011]